MLEESMDYVPQLVEREALTHRFFLSFSYDPSMKAPDHTPEAIAAVLNEKAEVARRYLDRCGVAVLEPEYADNFILELFYKLINKHLPASSSPGRGIRYAGDGTWRLR